MRIWPVVWGLAVLLVATLGTHDIAEAAVTLDAPASVTAGAPYKVTWSGGSNPRDFITLVSVGAAAGSYEAYKYANAPTVELRAPDEPGDYELRYLGADSPYPTLASQPVTVTPATATVEVPGAIAAGATIPVTWTGPNHPQDFITIVAAGTPEGKYAHYAYTTKGSPLELRAPDVAGSYEVRYLTGQKYYTLAAAPIEVQSTGASVTPPAAVTAGEEFPVSWTGPDNAQDWVGVFAVGGDDKAYSMYRYTAKGSPVMLRAPDEPGTYEVRYMTGQSNTALVSVPFQVNPVTASIEAPAEVVGGTVFSFTWKGPGHRGDFIGMAAAGAGERPNYAVYTYTHDGNPGEMPAPLEPGNYELRYETGQSARILTRVPIRVTPPTVLPGTIVVVSAQSGSILGLGPNDAIELILDASGSMLQKQGGKRRIDIAKEVLSKLAGGTIPAGTPFAMRVFGHKEKDSCRTDLEIPLRPLDPAAVASKVGAIEAMNLAKTPIAHSLELVAQDLSAVKGQRVVVLITDGEETCGGDPAAVIEALKAAGLDVRINIVGFAIDDAALKDAFRYWANLGGGSYHDATSAEALAASLSTALQTPFEIVDASGRVVASGLVGGPAVSLPVGTYTVRARPAFETSVTVESATESRVTVSG